jgi:hypothetical protein
MPLYAIQRERVYFTGTDFHFSFSPKHFVCWIPKAPVGRGHTVIVGSQS